MVFVALILLWPALLIVTTRITVTAAMAVISAVVTNVVLL